VRTQTASAPQRRPERKPAPPQPTGSENAGTASRTEDAGTASRTEDAGTASGTEDSGTASGTNAGGQQTQAAGGGAPDLPDPPSFDDTAQGETGTRTAEAASDAAAAGGEAANGEANGGEANGGEAASGGTGSTTGTATGTTQTARLPEGALPDQLRLDFGRGASELTPAIESTLSRLAEELKAQPEQRIQLKAFAAAEGGNASQARRLSLSRALAVRSFLIDQGIRSTRMDVRALGNTADSGPLDRVDIVPATR
jgi:outer membrane protein OmpA-like peptidoglycan-associated protein